MKHLKRFNESINNTIEEVKDILFEFRDLDINTEIDVKKSNGNLDIHIKGQSKNLETIKFLNGLSDILNKMDSSGFIKIEESIQYHNVTNDFYQVHLTYELENKPSETPTKNALKKYLDNENYQELGTDYKDDISYKVYNGKYINLEIKLESDGFYFIHWGEFFTGELDLDNKDFGISEAEIKFLNKYVLNDSDDKIKYDKNAVPLLNKIIKICKKLK